MSLESDRRAIGARNEAERRAIGARNAAERKASGQRIRADLDRTIRPERKVDPLPAIEPRGSRPATTGRGTWTPPSSASTGAGIASPLTEKTVAPGGAPDREYWPLGLPSSDGLFMLPAIKTLNLIDANGAAVQIQLADPGV